MLRIALDFGSKRSNRDAVPGLEWARQCWNENAVDEYEPRDRHKLQRAGGEGGGIDWYGLKRRRLENPLFQQSQRYVLPALIACRRPAELQQAIERLAPQGIPSLTARQARRYALMLCDVRLQAVDCWSGAHATFALAFTQS